MIFNLGNTVPVYELQISGVPLATVTVSNTKKTYLQTTDAYGKTVFSKLKRGLWSVVVRKGLEEAAYTVNVGRNHGNSLNINAIPEFSYNGIYEIVDDNENEIVTAVKNWKIRLLTSGTFVLKKQNNAVNEIDVFCVGGGGGGTAFRFTDADGGGEPGRGGGGGYTTTERGISISENIDYPITVGEGGIGDVYPYSSAVQAGSSEAFGVIAKGGYSGNMGNGGDGGSGGGACDRLGGEDGKDGQNWDLYKGGKGQGTTTREFGEPTGNLYSTGGHGGATWGSPNWGLAGNGGCGAWSNQAKGSNGGSGIVIIRNAR